MRTFFRWLAPVLLVMACGQFASAQDQSGSEAEMRAEQQKLIERLHARPDDLDAMFAYAVVSIRLRDYEPAIATLERMLIYRNDLPRVKLELGSAYSVLALMKSRDFISTRHLREIRHLT